MSARRRLAPEVVQTSVMDCGPATLACLLEGHGVPASYDRLREACQTDVDGTSIDTLEEVARELGLDAEQVLVPVDHVARPAARTLPAIVVVLLPSGATHFVVAWSRLGRRVQVMDPVAGRRFTGVADLRSQAYAHAFEVPAAGWRAWAQGREFAEPLYDRLVELGCSGRGARARLETALGDETWRSLATLDAACRMTAALVASGAVRRGAAARRLLDGLLARARDAPQRAREIIPSGYWYASGGAEGRVVLRGAVLVRVRGRLERAAAADPAERGSSGPTGAAPAPSEELETVLDAPRLRVGRVLAGLVGARAGSVLPVLAAGLVLATFAVLVQTVLLRGLIDVSTDLALPVQRLGALGFAVAFLVALALVELPLARTALRLGRGLEADLRVRFQTGVAKLAERYFRSRPASDMAERAHSIVLAAGIGSTGVELSRLGCQLVLTAAGIAWLDPSTWPLAVASVLVSVLLPLFARRSLVERELAVRNLRGALSRVYLEALLGLVPVRTHGAERIVRREHGSLLEEWRRASLRLGRLEIALSGAQSLVGLTLAAAIVVRHFQAAESAGGTLLLCYWALAIPGMGNDLVLAVQKLPSQENVARRLLEPLSRAEDGEGASEEPVAEPSVEPEPARDVVARTALRAAGPVPARGVATTAAAPATSAPAFERAVEIRLRGVDAVACGHTILEAVDLELPAGCHAAIVGPSGAGKSTLVGLLLGLSEPARGTLTVDGRTLRGARLQALRRATAWVDPGVRLFNRSLLENLRFGNEDADALRVGEVLARAHLGDVLEKLPDGLQAPLGEGGGLLSGGEGQRVRLARAACREGVHLAILDEPFRGLERERRRALLASARELWADATLLCVTHDLEETRDFDRVVVVEDGRVVECGPPAELLGRVSRYRALMEAERRLTAEVWGDPSWTRVELVDGGLV